MADGSATSPPTPATIRRALSADLDGLVDLELRFFASDRLSRRSLRRFLHAAGAIFILADAAGKIAGYALALTRRGSGSARLYSLVRDPASGPPGLGRALLAATEAAASADGCKRIHLEVREDNERARHLYATAGYAGIGRLEGYYEDGADGLRMAKMLTGETR